MTVYKNQSFSKAAKELYTTQPAISYYIKELEKYLNVQLFHRVHNGVLPTEEGNELYRYILEAFQVIKFGEEKIQKLSTLATGTIRIGIPSHIGVFYLNEKIQQFYQLYPHIKFEIVCKSIADMSKMLEMKQLDIIIETRPLSVMKNHLSIKNDYLMQLHYCFIAHKDLKLSNFSLTEFLKKVSAEKLIIPNMGAPAWNGLNEIFRKVSIELKARVEVWTSEMILDLVYRKVGVGYFIKEFIPPQFELLMDVLEDKTFPTIDLQISYILEFQSVSSKKFIDFLKEGCVTDE